MLLMLFSYSVVWIRVLHMSYIWLLSYHREQDPRNLIHLLGTRWWKILSPALLKQASVMIWKTSNKQIFWLWTMSFLPRGSVLLWIPSCVRQVNGERRSSISTELTGNYVQTLFYKLWDFWSKIHRSDLFSPYKCLTTSMWFLSQGLTYFAVIVCVCRSSLMY